MSEIVDKAKKVRAMIERAAAMMQDSDAVNAQDLFPRWNGAAEYDSGDRVRYKDALYRCLIQHTAQKSWMPDVSPSLWVRVDNPAEEYPEWVQTIGSHDAYSAGDKVSHNDKHWISSADSNVWEPGVYGWEEVTE